MNTDSFALYRLPKQEPILKIQSLSNPRVIPTFEELNGLTGFVLAPYKIIETAPIMLIEPDKTLTGKDADAWLSEHSQLKFGPQLFTFPNNMEKMGFNRYCDTFIAAIKKMKKKELQKIVLVRTKHTYLEKGYSATKAFYDACEMYPSAFVYLCYTPISGLWIGATPEILISGEDTDWHTFALAGTVKKGKTKKVAWNEKNREEQELVSDYIRGKLKTANLKWKEEGPYTIQAGKLAHLQTDFNFTLPQTSNLGDMVALLHPTPAVCGLPEETATKLLEKYEDFNRLYYSGFLGVLNPKGKTDLYVNLRCMRLDTGTALLYAGSGVIASSNLTKEWKETEDKLETMLVLLK